MYYVKSLNNKNIKKILKLKKEMLHESHVDKNWNKREKKLGWNSIVLLILYARNLRNKLHKKVKQVYTRLRRKKGFIKSKATAIKIGKLNFKQRSDYLATLGRTNSENVF